MGLETAALERLKGGWMVARNSKSPANLSNGISRRDVLVAAGATGVMLDSPYGAFAAGSLRSGYSWPDRDQRAPG